MQAAGGAALTSEPDPVGGSGPATTGGGATPTRRPRRRRPLYLLVAGLAVLLVTVDQLVKIWAENALADGRRIEVVGELFQLRLVYNPGAAFSFATGATGLLTIIAIGVVVFVIWTARRLGSLGWAWALGLLLGGAIGNLIDRLFRAPGPGRGHVVDMFALPNFPVFNVADACITSAAVLIVILALRGIGLDGTKEGERPPTADADGAPGGASRG